MKKLFQLPIMFYRKFISPLKRTPSCKYYPTCSAYALQAYEKHGVIKGTVLTVKRLLRCNPWSKGGVDPVPEEYRLFGFLFCRADKKQKETNI